MSEKYSAAPNAMASPGKGGEKAATMSSVAIVPAKNDPIAGDRERGAGTALAGHLIAVERGDDRRGFARHFHQDRGGRPAVLRRRSRCPRA